MKTPLPPRARIALCLVLLAALPARAQKSAYLGYVYPAGGARGSTFEVKAGGQGLTPAIGVEVTGTGVTARVVENYPRIGPQEITLLRDQLKTLRDSRKPAGPAPVEKPGEAAMAPAPAPAAPAPAAAADPAPDPAVSNLIRRIETRIREHCDRPACNALVDLVFLEVQVAANAPPGRRELRVVTPRGVSNPMAFHVGTYPETTRKPMLPASFQVLGKEELALRKRPEEEVEARVTPPCVMNGQIASGEVNRYRFPARKGQQLVISVLARELVPFIADAVPGWFQPVLRLEDANGREVAYQDDFRFKPDPTLHFEVPADGEYVVSITDALNRGREDFLYRLTLGETPFLTGVFPLGAPAGSTPSPALEGWNLGQAAAEFTGRGSGEGLGEVVARAGNQVSNALPFAWDSLPETEEREPNDPGQTPQRLTLPIIVNGRIGSALDRDAFEFEGKAGAKVVVEVLARRLGSPLDSVLQLLGPDGAALGLNDDHEDLASGVNTHHADSYLLVTLPADGVYRIHLGDSVRGGGKDFAYRLRVGPPRPRFDLQVTPSSLGLRGKNSATLTVFVARRDGYDGPVKVDLASPPPGLVCPPVTIPAGQRTGKLSVKTEKGRPEGLLDLTVVGTADVDGQSIRRTAVPGEDRMQAFLWRHLVPADNLRAQVYDPDAKPPARPLPPPCPETLAAAQKEAPKFAPNQVAGRLRQIDQLYQEGLFTDDFAAKRIAECKRSEGTP